MRSVLRIGLVTWVAVSSLAAGSSLVGVTLPELVRVVAPRINSAAPDERVTVLVTVKADGTVGEVTVKNPVGSPLEEEVVRVVHKWVFRPAMRGGHTVACKISVPISFESQSGDLIVDLSHYFDE